jgi:hypothetical protein
MQGKAGQASATGSAPTAPAFQNPPSANPDFQAPASVLEIHGFHGWPPSMSTITASLTDEDLAFLQRFSEAQGTSVSEFLARLARSLRRQLEKPLPPEILVASGIVVLPRAAMAFRTVRSVESE